MRYLISRIAIAALMLVVLISGAWSADRRLTLLTWNAPQNEPMFRAWIEGFRSKHPDVVIDWLDKTGADWATFFQTQLVAGTPPDIINVQGTLWAEYASNDLLVDLTPLMDKEPEVRARYHESVMKYWTLDKRVYGVPYYINKSLLYYNKLLFEKAGLERPPRDFKELLEYADKLAKLGDATTGLLTLSFDWLYWPLFAANGIDLLNKDMTSPAFNTPKMVEVVKQLEAATRSGAINKISWTGRWREPNSAFASGTVGMYIAHGGAYYNFRQMGKWMNPDTVGAIEFPGGWGVLNSHGLMITKASKHPDLAWEFVKQVTDAKWALETGKRITRTTGNKEADAKLLEHLSKTDSIGFDIMAAQSASLDKLSAMWNSPLDAKIKEAFWPELQNALLGQTPAEAAISEAERKVARVLRRGR
jgi:ABC-type glycerol-3-phosphate transport system substrate-binding protein